MTAALLAADVVQQRRAQFRREESRQDFLSPLSDGGPPLADRGISTAEPQAGRQPPEPIRKRPIEPAANAAAVPRPPAEILPPPSEIPGPQSSQPGPEPPSPPPDNAAADARELLGQGPVRELLSGKPPTRRNREIFRAVVVEGRPQRAVARQFQITQPRVSQIVRQVRIWLSRVVVEQDEACSRLEQIQLAENITRMQYDHLYSTALDLLHGRGMAAAELAEGQNGSPPHKPNAAFLNAAIRAVNSKAKFEGIMARPARRALDEAEQRGISMFGPTNDNLARSETEPADQPEGEPEYDLSYNPLSPDPLAEEDEPLAPEDVSETFREGYAQFPGWFAGDFDSRAAYYRTQTPAVFGPPEEGEDPRDEECGRIEWLHEMDLLAAEACKEAMEFIHRDRSAAWSVNQVYAFRRRLLVLNMRKNQWTRYDSDAEELLRSCQYDDASGRFGWDLRFLAQGEEASGGCGSKEAQQVSQPVLNPIAN